MSATKRKAEQDLRRALRRHTGIKGELDRLEKAANEQIRKSLPRLRCQPGELAEAFLDDLAEVVNHNDWRPSVERSADQLRAAAKHIRKAVRLAVKAAQGCPTYAAIPSIVWESTLDARAERRRIGALPAGDKLFGKGGAIESFMKSQQQRVINAEKTAPGFLRAMLVYATQCDREAARLDSILKTRDSRYDRLGP